MDILINIFIAIITGAYSGLIVARASTFYSLKRQAHRVINNCDYMLEDEGWIILKQIDIAQLHDVASDLLRLKHQKSGLVLLTVIKELNQLNTQKHLDSHISLSDTIQGFQNTIRSMAPNWKAILFLGPLQAY